MADDEFLIEVMTYRPPVLTQALRSAPPRYALKARWVLLSGATGGSVQARRVIVHLRARQVPHEPGRGGLGDGMRRLLDQGAGPHHAVTLTHSTRVNLEDRVGALASLLAQHGIGLDYATVFHEVKYYGPDVTRRWLDALHDGPSRSRALATAP